MTGVEIAGEFCNTPVLEGFRERRGEERSGRMDLKEDEVGWWGRKQMKESSRTWKGNLYVR